MLWLLHAFLLHFLPPSFYLLLSKSLTTKIIFLGCSEPKKRRFSSKMIYKMASCDPLYNPICWIHKLMSKVWETANANRINQPNNKEKNCQDNLKLEGRKTNREADCDRVISKHQKILSFPILRYCCKFTLKYYCSWSTLVSDPSWERMLSTDFLRMQDITMYMIYNSNINVTSNSRIVRTLIYVAGTLSQ